MDVDGYFNANDDPAIQIDLGGGAIEILIDTGFGGWLILSNSQAAGLALRFEGFEEFFTATGQGFTALTYFLELDWLGQRTTVPVAVSSDTTEALLGGQMLNGSRLTIDYHDRNRENR